MNSVAEVLQALIPLGLAAVEDAFQVEVRRLVGERYQRTDRTPGHARWGRQRGSVYLLDQKLAFQVPRVRDRERNSEIPLDLYQRLQEPRQGDGALLPPGSCWA